MSQYHETDLGISTKSVEELDLLARSCTGVVGRISSGYATTASMEGKVFAGGWAAKWINTKGLGNEGTLVLVATDRRTREILREGKINFYEAKGFSEENAIKFYSAPCQHKELIASSVAEALKNPGIVLACRQYRDGSMEDHRAWVKAWAEVFDGKDPKEYFGLTFWIILEVIKAVKYMAE